MADWKLESKLPRVRAGMKEGRRRGLMAAAEHVLGVSNMRVPHEFGDFERTGVASVDPEAGVAAVSYKDADYGGQAVDQHENDTYHHDNGRAAHFLRDALNSERTVILGILGQGVKRGMGN